MTPLLEVQNLSYTPNGHFRLHPVSFTLEAGQLLAIVGASGSGKTTLLQLIAGLLEPETGQLVLNGEKITGPSRNLVPGHPAIKLVFQHFGLSPKINVYQNIAYLLKAYPPSEKQAKVQALLRLCQLEGLEKRMPQALSGGEKQRLASARALADDPLLLLLDEPFSNLDTMLKKQLKKDITNILKQTDTTAILVTHDMQDALSVADQIAVMQHGRFVQTGTPRQMYENPATPYVAELFGTCNFLETAQLSRILPEAVGNGKMACLRAEHIHLSQEKGLSGHIVKVLFMGAFAEVTVRIEDILLTARTCHCTWKEDNLVGLVVEKNKILYF